MPPYATLSADHPRPGVPGRAEPAAARSAARRVAAPPVQLGLFDDGGQTDGPGGLRPTDGVLLERLAAGGTVVVRLPGLFQPYGPLLRHLADTGRLVRIGRDTIWGNPHRLHPGASSQERAEAIAAYERHLQTRPDLLARVGELRGRALGCWCAPAPCHGDVLARLAHRSG
ncbi:protein of unknown function (DUF4326) [Parafrankia irregularis]|uniref:DUF4326 domain-containing protein n=1 Tax=Parafrankia irregularis TaxID=795642 RepID=A0A0S4R0F3_9ACTN|nr:DUF4326 domain-containing protein [Parafrankia irregularis]CUU60846.1 protein of unknown function (DUF4326) [Parafrankia irregularis]